MWNQKTDLHAWSCPLNQSYLKDQCPLGQKSNVLTGYWYTPQWNKEDLIKKMLKFQKYPALLEKIKDWANLTSLSRIDIPPSTSLWKQDKCPKVNRSNFESYCEHKRQGIAGQQQKAHRSFLSRKVVIVKVLQENNETFVKGTIKKSYGHISRPAVLKSISSGIPNKGHCTCPTCLSGFCCHILCLLHFLIHLTETWEKFVTLTVTQQLQNSIKRGKGRDSYQCFLSISL